MPMELKDQETVGSDDEEDLEKLRLAALQSLKRPTPHEHLTAFKKSPQGMKRRHFGRNRNGQFRIKNTNLISIPTIDDSPTTQKEKEEIKLVLPQDRYMKKSVGGEEKSESTSKFDRYDNSDKSESESEYESTSDSEPPAKLERTDSLEALMQELENEIQGNNTTTTVTKEVSAVESKKKIRRKKKKIELESKENEIEKEVEKPVEPQPPPPLSPKKENPIVNKTTPISSNFEQHRRATFQKFDRKPRNPPKPYQPQFIPYQIPPNYPPPLLYPTPAPISYTPPPIIPQPQSQIYYDRPLSPLIIKSDDPLAIARAPLSPRSAAFVLQNRDAIERRKKSPPPSLRRSYSRSPTPTRYHRSKSKERSRTPVKDERRTPPPIKEVIRKRRSPENGNNSNNKKRLGRSGGLNVKKKRSRTVSPQPQVNKVEGKEVKTKTKDEVKLDPVLEARKRKFESNEIKSKEGIIRLKPKHEESKPELESIDESKNLDSIEKETNELDFEETIDDILNTKVDDLFSDEETDEENEGRFKNSLTNNDANSKTKTTGTVPYNNKSNPKGNFFPRDRPRSPLRSKEAKLDNSNNKRLPAPTRKPKSEQHHRKEKLVAAPIENKKIEIKIRNPSKYETTSKYDVKSEPKESKPARKVEVGSLKKKSQSDKVEGSESNKEGDNKDGQKSDSGDLRAQLSRKRAERQSRLPTLENVQSRLLQNALQGAVFKKQKKAKVDTETAPKEYAAVKRTAKLANVTSLLKRLRNGTDRKVRFLCSELDRRPGEDGKVPIHLRLGTADSYQGDQGNPKKSGKTKGHTEQV